MDNESNETLREQITDSEMETDGINSAGLSTFRQKPRLKIRTNGALGKPANSSKTHSEKTERPRLPRRGRLSADIERDLLVRLKICSAITGTSIATLVQELIRSYINDMPQSVRS